MKKENNRFREQTDIQCQSLKGIDCPNTVSDTSTASCLQDHA